MKRIFSILIFLPLAISGFTQTSADIAKWETYLDSTQSNIEFKVTIKEGWHLYSQFLTGDGPIPTTFSIADYENIKLVGNVIEENAKTAFDPNFDMQISYFEESAVFKQKIKKLNDNPISYSGSIEFMVCDDHMCYPPETIEFDIKLP